MTPPVYLPRGAFDALRAEQVSRWRTPTPLDNAAGEVVYRNACAAWADVAGGALDAPIRAVSLSTGVGKSTAAYAFIAAACQHDPEFACAFVTQRVALAVDAQRGIEELLGPDTVTLWSTYHDVTRSRRDEREAHDRLGYVPGTGGNSDRLVSRDALAASRVVVVTHKAWLGEVKRGRNGGITTYNGKPRAVTFVDEAPSLVDLLPLRLEDVDEMFTRVAQVHGPRHPWCELLSTVHGRMHAIVQEPAQAYAKARIVMPGECTAFFADPDTGETVGDPLHLLRALADTSALTLPGTQVCKWNAVVDALRAAESGHVFYSQRDVTFYAYRPTFNTGAGVVLLDATADIDGVTVLNAGVELADVPPVSFARLELFHLRHPQSFGRMQDVMKSATTAKPYAAWVRESVLLNTQPGEDVLVFVHKRLTDHGHIALHDDPAKPDDWGGRRINVAYWGAGIGTNEWRNKRVVFLFGDFVLPRSATIGRTHGYGGDELSDATLRDAVGVHVMGYEYAPGGIYRQPHEGHLLRWVKQSVMRGNARNFDGDGVCGPMRLYTSGSLRRLVQFRDVLFPGAALPRPGHMDKSARFGDLGKRDRLTYLLMNPECVELSAWDVEARTGLLRSKLGREFETDTVQLIGRLYGWRLATAKELGRPGRSRYLVRDAAPALCHAA